MVSIIAPKEESEAPAYRIKVEKLSVEAALITGAVGEIGNLINLFSVATHKTLNLHERKVLEKVVHTLVARHGLKQIEALKAARKCGAAEPVLVGEIHGMPDGVH